MKKWMALLLILLVFAMPASLLAEDQPIMLPQTPQEQTVHPKQPNFIFDIIHGACHLLSLPFELVGGLLSGGKK